MFFIEFLMQSRELYSHSSNHCLVYIAVQIWIRNMDLKWADEITKGSRRFPRSGYIFSRQTTKDPLAQNGNLRYDAVLYMICCKSTIMLEDL